MPTVEAELDEHRHRSSRTSKQSSGIVPLHSEANESKGIYSAESRDVSAASECPEGPCYANAITFRAALGKKNRMAHSMHESQSLRIKLGFVLLGLHPPRLGQLLQAPQKASESWPLAGLRGLSSQGLAMVAQQHGRVSTGCLIPAGLQATNSFPVMPRSSASSSAKPSGPNGSCLPGAFPRVAPFHMHSWYGLRQFRCESPMPACHAPSWLLGEQQANLVVT